MTRRAVCASMGALGLLLTAGCGRPVLRIADPSLGDYYTDREFQRLRKDQRDEYCNDLADQDSSYLAAIADLTGARSEIEARRERATTEADSLTRVADSLGVALAAARARAEAVPATRTVRRGDCLWRIAADPKTYGDGHAWRRLYEANREKIRNPDLIYPGQELTIPR